MLVPTVIFLAHASYTILSCSPNMASKDVVVPETAASELPQKGTEPPTTTETAPSPAIVTVDTTVPWSDNTEDQQAASLPIETQLRNLGSIYVDGAPKTKSIEHTPNGNGTRIVSEIGWTGTESQLKEALTEAFRYNNLLSGFEVSMSK